MKEIFYELVNDYNNMIDNIIEGMSIYVLIALCLLLLFLMEFIFVVWFNLQPQKGKSLKEKMQYLREKMLQVIKVNGIFVLKAYIFCVVLVWLVVLLCEYFGI